MHLVHVRWCYHSMHFQYKKRTVSAGKLFLHYMCIGNKGLQYYNPQNSPKNKGLQTKARVCDNKGLLLEGCWVMSNIFSQGPSSSKLTALVVNSLARSGGTSTLLAKAGAKVGGKHVLMEAEHPTFIQLEKSAAVRFRSSSGEDRTDGRSEMSVSSCNLSVCTFVCIIVSSNCLSSEINV